MINSNNISRRSGFSLVEVVVAITILTIAVIGPMTLSAQSIRATREARLELIATHLAEEGIEIVHSIRGNNSADETDLVNRVSWMDGTTINVDVLQECRNGDGCIPHVVEHPGVSGADGGGTGVWTDEVLERCNGGCDSVVYQNSAGFYRQRRDGLSSPWVATPFRRVIYVTGVDHPSNPVRQVRVQSDVTYETYGGTRTISVRDDLYNWFPNLN